MQKITEVTKTYGRLGGTNYFVLPKMTECSTLYGYKFPKATRDKFEKDFKKLVKLFKDNFLNMKNQTIHIFASIEWNFLKIDFHMKDMNPEQFQFLYDYNMGKEYAELRNFHNIQRFIYELYTLDNYEFMKNNRVVFHCNIDYYDIIHMTNMYRYIFSNLHDFYINDKQFVNSNQIKLQCHYYDKKSTTTISIIPEKVKLKFFFVLNSNLDTYIKIEKVIEEGN